MREEQAPDTQNLDKFGAAARLKISTRTLDRLREEGKGPVWFRVGSQVRYRREAIEDWEREQEEAEA